MGNNEDIKIVEELLKEFKTYNDLDGIQDLRLYIKAIENLLSRLKTAERMNDVLAEIINNHDIDEDVCKQMGKDFDCTLFNHDEKFCKECIKEWARKKVEDV